jgi:hypothetical protein
MPARRISVSVAAVCLVGTVLSLSSEAAVAAVNLIVNGDFSVTNPKAKGHGFTSEYTYSHGDLYKPQTYDVVSSAAELKDDNRFFVYPSGYSHFMALNGSTDTVLQIAWKESVTLTPNTTYLFQGWDSSLVTAAPATLKFYVFSYLIGSSAAPSDTDAWRQFSAYFTYSGKTKDTYNIEIIDTNTTAIGNDFGLANLSLTPIKSAPAGITPVTVAQVPEPGIWSLLLAGFASLGVLGNRRRKLTRAAR